MPRLRTEARPGRLPGRGEGEQKRCAVTLATAGEAGSRVRRAGGERHYGAPGTGLTARVEGALR